MSSKIKVDQIENTSGSGDVAFTGTGGIKLDTIKSSGGTTAMSIDSGGRVLMPARVCWMFIQSGTFTITGETSTSRAKWDTEVVNIGNAWNGADGYRLFTAPVAGTYRISWGFTFQDGDNARFVASRIYKGGSLLGSVHRQTQPTAQAGNQYDGHDHTHIYTFTQNETWYVVPQSSSTISISAEYGTYCCGELIG